MAAAREFEAITARDPIALPNQQMSFHAGRPDVEGFAWGRRVAEQRRRQVRRNACSRRAVEGKTRLSASATGELHDAHATSGQWVARNRYAEVAVGISIRVDAFGHDVSDAILDDVE